MPAEAIRARVEDLPVAPGVYLFKNAAGHAIYVGKANRIRDRIRSHLRGGWEERRQQRMLDEAVDIEVIVTDSEVEALALENSLIKQNNPRFNVLLRDDKNYPYLRLTEGERFPRLQLVRGMESDGDSYFGPYIPNTRARLMQVVVYRSFGLRPCNIDIDGSWERPCLYYDIGECAGPCVESLCNDDQYAEISKEVKLFLQGRGEDLRGDLEGKMQRAADNQAYERAAHYRDLLQTVEASTREQKMASRDLGNRDLFAIHREDDRVALQVFLVRDGLVVERRQYFWDDVGGADDEEILTTCVQQYYHGGTNVPAEVCLPREIAGADVLADWLRSERGKAVQLLVPKRGPKKRLLELVAQNAQLAFAHRYEKNEAERGAQLLQELLDLGHPPQVLQCIDVSNLQGKQIVASLVSLRDGRPDKNSYKRFKIRDLPGQDDFASIAQVVTRHFRRVLDGDVKPPDLLLIDGGKGQLSAAVGALDELGMQQQPVVSIEKGEEKLFVPGRDPVPLQPHPEALRLVQQVRDEAHRFAITYHRALRSKTVIRSQLDDIPGVGPKRRRELLEHFGSVACIKAASREDLVAAVGPVLAARIIEFLAADEVPG
ncbi:MAG: excinuclease ABC subunit UvrC [Acidobacteria bacterium]|nr:excinuclease ABC subunit UvrC [Acidobacteriota bacterium]